MKRKTQTRRKAMSLFMFEFPIPDYYGKEVFMKKIFIESSKCPSKDGVVAILQKAENEEKELESQHPEWGPYCHEYLSCLEAIDECDSFPYAYEGLVHTGGFCNTKFGKYLLSVTRIKPFVI
jgi:hypothetical protein